MLCILNVGPVSTLCILNVGTVPMLCILNIGTVPTFSHSPIGNLNLSCIELELGLGFDKSLDSVSPFGSD